MAVYTHVSDEALEAFLSAYDLGRALSFKGIAEGVENSNYLLETERGRFILTLFEKRVAQADLPYFIALKQHLAAAGFPCPAPVAARNGAALRVLEHRPALIVTFLQGLSPRRPTPAQCAGLGAALANMHLAARDFAMTRTNTLGAASWPRLFNDNVAGADALEAGLGVRIAGDLAALADFPAASLPQGTIHADLFPDNAFFEGDRFTGAIDFYFACTDALAYDLAICLNAWAFDDHAQGTDYNYTKGRRMIEAYQSVRPLSGAERAALPMLARGAAMRFFQTRFHDWTATPPGALVRPKNPLDYARRLDFHREAKGPEDYGA
jgi:homoserine kinase type II